MPAPLCVLHIYVLYQHIVKHYSARYGSSLTKRRSSLRESAGLSFHPPLKAKARQAGTELGEMQLAVPTFGSADA